MSKVNKEVVNSGSNIPRSSFPLTFHRRLTTNFGRLVPILCQPVVPTDHFKIRPEFILRTMPFIGQVFQQYRVALDYFYVPNNVLWKNFDLFISGGHTGESTYVHPYLDLDRFLNNENPDFYQSFQYLNSLFDYFDISPYQRRDSTEPWPSGERRFYPKSLLPFAAYAKIVLDYYTNQFLDLGDVIQDYMQKGWILQNDGELGTPFIQLMNALHLQKFVTSVTNLTFLPVIRPFDWDYFTDQRTSQQHGPVLQIPLELINSDREGTYNFKLSSNSSSSVTKNVLVRQTLGSDEITLYPDGQSTNPITISADIFKNVATIYDLRTAERVLNYFESIGFVGWKPEDYNLSQFGAKSSNHRLFRAERIGHEVFTVNIGEVFSNNASAINTQGEQHDVPGVATSTAKGYGRMSDAMTYRVPEFGYIMGLASVYPVAAYSQGCPRHFDMLDRFDYPNPKFAHLGLQPTKNSELYHTGHPNDDETFGFTRRYAEYTTNLNRINSEFRDSLKYMTSSRLFNQHMASHYFRPKLNEAFNKVQVGYNDLNRVFNVEFPQVDSGPIILDINQEMHANRPFPWTGEPRV